MDPITAMLVALNSILELKKMYFEALSPELRAEESKWAHEDLKAWREFFDRFKLPALTQEDVSKIVARTIRDEMHKASRKR